MTGLIREMARLLSAYQTGSRLALVFNYHTLTETCAYQCRAPLPDGTRSVLDRLSCQPRVTVGVLGERPLEELRRMVGLKRLYYGGLRGADFDLCGRRVGDDLVQPRQLLLAAAAARLGKLLADFPGVWIDRNDAGLTLRYPGVPRAAVDLLLDRAQQALREFNDGLGIVNGGTALEVRPGAGWNKVSAVRLLRDRAGPDSFLLYAGDGDDDAAAIDVTMKLGGLAVGVGPEAPARAPFRLADTAALVDFLRDFLHALLY